MRTMLRSKIHRATVTEANVDYEGSITIDAELLDAAGIVAFERVQVVDITNGARFETYAIAGPRRSGVICINGAAARLVHPGDLIIVITYAAFTPEEAAAHRPVIVLLDADNSIRDRITADQARDAEYLADG